MILSRRRFIRQTFAFSAAALLAGSADSAPATSSPSEPSVPQAPSTTAHLLALGDWGVRKKDLERQRAVADGMARYVVRCGLRPDALALLGDNFYGGLGGDGVNSARWNLQLEKMYDPATFPCPLYALLGNHDYSDERDDRSALAQLAYRRHAPDSRWTMPGKWYRFEVPERNPVASVCVIDTNFAYGGKIGPTRAERKQQARWLSDELSKPRTAPFLFVFGHHPVYSGGTHGDTNALIEQVDPLLRKHRVDLYLSGHDHDLQHIEFEGHPTSFIVSGAGGARSREVRERKRGGFAKSVYGFTHIELARARFVLRHVDANGTELHAFEKRSRA